MSATITRASDLQGRVAAGDWSALIDEVNDYGCAQTQAILTPAECREIAALYDEPEHFRSTITMERYRFGAGE